MECGSPSTIGLEADSEGFKAGFAHDPLWKVSLIDETVDVASSGDLAVYRGTYNEDNSRAGVLVTHKTNFIAEFKRQGDGTWRIVWYSVPTWENRIRNNCRMSSGCSQADFAQLKITRSRTYLIAPLLGQTVGPNDRDGDLSLVIDIVYLEWPAAWVTSELPTTRPESPCTQGATMKGYVGFRI